MLTMKAERNRKKKGFLFFCLAKAHPVRNCHHSANVKPLYIQLSEFPGGPLGKTALSMQRAI